MYIILKQLCLQVLAVDGAGVGSGAEIFRQSVPEPKQKALAPHRLTCFLAIHLVQNQSWFSAGSLLIPTHSQWYLVDRGHICTEQKILSQ
jgi:hypothetical protein